MSTKDMRTAGHSTHLSQMEEQLRRVVCPCIVLIVVYYVMYDQLIMLQCSTAQQSCDGGSGQQ